MAQDTVYRVPYCHAQPRVLHSDDHILVVDKPSGLLSVPGRHPDNRDCLVSRLQAQWPNAAIVHRLDMDTSGIMVLALNPGAHSHLSRQFQQRQVCKRYLAVVAGIVSDDSGVIDLPLIADWPRRPLQKVCHRHGKAALTRYRVLAREPERHLTRLILEPETGRSHQLRVHLAELGHPILGDNFYAPGSVRQRAQRLLLHARELGFIHPYTGQPLSFHTACDLETGVDSGNCQPG